MKGWEQGEEGRRDSGVEEKRKRKKKKKKKGGGGAINSSACDIGTTSTSILLYSRVGRRRHDPKKNCRNSSS